MHTGHRLVKRHCSLFVRDVQAHELLWSRVPLNLVIIPLDLVILLLLLMQAVANLLSLLLLLRLARVVGMVLLNLNG